MNEVMTFPEWFKIQREWSVTSLAAFCKVHRVTVHRWLNGARPHHKHQESLINVSNGNLTYESLNRPGQ